MSYSTEIGDMYPIERIKPQLDVFSPEELAAARTHRPEPKVVNELEKSIAILCIPEGEMHHGRYWQQATDGTGRSYNLEWSPTQNGYGSGADISTANLNNFRREKRVINGRVHHVCDDLVIDSRGGGTALIRRRISAATDNYHYRGRRVATADEAAEALDVMHGLEPTSIWRPKVRRGKEVWPIQDMDLTVEAGFGLAPSVLVGNRRFKHQLHLAVDSAVGNYENPVGNYPLAVQQTASNISSLLKSQRADEHAWVALARAENLPVANGRVSELLLQDIVNAPIPIETKQAILLEARRVLHRWGVLVLKTTWHQDVWPREEIEEFLYENRFSRPRFVHHKYEPFAYDLLEQRYGKPVNPKTPPGFFAIVHDWIPTDSKAA